MRAVSDPLRRHPQLGRCEGVIPSRPRRCCARRRGRVGAAPTTPIGKMLTHYWHVANSYTPCMSTTPRRTRLDPEQRRSQILDAAGVLFATRGYDDVSIE